MAQRREELHLSLVGRVQRARPVEAVLAAMLARQQPVAERAARAMAAPTLVEPLGVAEPVAAVPEQVEEVAVPERVAAVLGTAALLQVAAVRAARAVAVVARRP